MEEIWDDELCESIVPIEAMTMSFTKEKRTGTEHRSRYELRTGTDGWEITCGEAKKPDASAPQTDDSFCGHSKGPGAPLQGN